MTYYLTSQGTTEKPGLRSVVTCEALNELPIPDGICLDWSERDRFRPAYPRIASVPELSFCFGGECVDMNDKSAIAARRDAAIAGGAYPLCKTINEACIEEAVIRRREQMDALPMVLQLETTDVCNARCVMCSHFYRQGTHGNTDCFRLLERLRPVLPFVRTVCLHGNGEPFLLPGIETFVEALAGYGIRCVTNTNLSRVDDTVIRLLQTHFDELNVSCEGASAPVYEYVRQGLRFDTFLNNCRRVRKECPDLYLRMCSIAMRQNADTLPDLVRMAAELGFNEIVFSELSADRRLENERDVMLLYPHVLRRQLLSAQKMGEECGIVVRVPDIPTGDDPDALALELQEMKKTPCYKTKEELNALSQRIALSSEGGKKELIRVGRREIPCLQGSRHEGVCDWLVASPFIDLDGNVAICCINQHIVLGNLFEESFADIWNGEAARSLRRCFYSEKMPVFCSGCEFILQHRLKYLRADEQNLHPKLRMKGQDR